MTVSDVLIILAVIAGPIIAVQVQKAIEKYKEARNRKLIIFKTLMATRGTPLAPMHVEALNRIDLEFDGKDAEEKLVIVAWKIYLDHLISGPGDQKDPNFKIKLESWADKNRDLLASLLNKMAKSLNYDFDEVHLKKGIYIPKGHSDIELEQTLIRKGLVDLFYGAKFVPVYVVKPPLKEDAEQKKEKEDQGLNSNK